MMAIDVRYLLEIYENGVLTRAFAIPMVGELRRVHIPPHTLTWTFGDEPVREHTGIRQDAYELRGRSGKKARREFVYNNGEASTFRPGPELFKQFSKFLDDYEETARRLQVANQRQRRGDVPLPAIPPALQDDLTNAYMVFRAVDENVHRKVEVSNFTWMRSSSSSRFSFEWSLNIQGYRPVEKSTPGLLGSIRDKIQSVSDAIDNATNYVAAGEETLAELNATANALREPIRATIRGARKLRDLGREIKGTVAIPRGFVYDFWTLARESTFAMYEILDAMPVGLKAVVQSAMYDAAGKLQASRRAALKALGETYTRKRTRSKRLASIVQTQSVAHTVVQGETLQDIAEQYIGDRTAWTEIAEFNGVISTFFGPSSEPLIAGTIIYVPLPIGGGAVTSQPANLDDLFGTDLALDANGDLVLNGNELAVVRGADNLNASLSDRLLTVQGENKVFPLFGLPQLVGEAFIAEMVGYATAHVNTQLLSDSRVEEVSELAVADFGDGMAIDAQVQSIAGATINVSLPYPV
jgi:hypothetical protein